VEGKINWTIKQFHELCAAELYDILRLRSEVFVVEQQCIFQDMDNLDQSAHHLQAKIGEELVATARILKQGIAFEVPSIGRVVSSPRYRKRGIGFALMEKAIEECIRLNGELPIKIGGQLYLKKFYENLGFEQCSDMYLEDNIPHISMIRLK
jgi:ElaA protein